MKNSTSAIFLPIKPVYANRIIEGTKHYEYRKIMPSKNVSHIVIYASSPRKRIVGTAKIEKILSGTVEKIWCKTSDYPGIDKASFLAYFEKKERAYAFKLSEIRRFEQDISPFDIWNDFKIPQSFSYLEKNLFSMLKRYRCEHVRC